MHPGSFQAPSFFVLRTPLLPFDHLLAWSADLQAPSALHHPTCLEQALAADRSMLRERLQGMFTHPAIRDALFVASPDLYDALERWAVAPHSEAAHKAELALVRYIARMAGRATPFGLFSGYAVGTPAEHTHLAVGPQSAYQRHTRFDMDYLSALAEVLRGDTALRAACTFRPNSTLYGTARRIRYAEARRNGKLRSYDLVAVETTPYLTHVLTEAQQGACPAHLAAALVAYAPDISLAEAHTYIDTLIDNQVLVPDLDLVVTGPEPVHALLAQLRPLPAATAAVQILEQAQAAMAAMDATGPGAEAERYRMIARHLAGLPAPVALARLFQVDLVKPADNTTLGQEPLAELQRGVALLQRLTRRQPQESLQRFCEKFTARYQDREVPLVEVLDEEVGIGFEASSVPRAEASPLLHGLDFLPQTQLHVPWGAREACLVRKLAEALTHGATQIELQSADLEALSDPDPWPLPASFAIMATIAASSEEALARGDFHILLSGASGPSGVRLMGRFCHADPLLRQHVEQHLRAEEALDPEAIYAEIVHVPEGRIGNVVCRPVLRDYEIPYLGRSGAPPECQIPLTDLLVSVVNGRIILRSQRLGRRIVPRLSSAHLYSLRSLGVYKFLGTLQAQDVAPGRLGWEWGVLESAPFLPRVVSGRFVLARARWLLWKEEVEALGTAQGGAQFQAMQELRSTRHLPRLVLFQEGDHELPVDLDNVLSIAAFVEVIKGRSQVTLVEMFPGPEALCAHGPEGRFVHELIVPFVQAPAAAPASAQRPALSNRSTAASPAVRYRLAPGSEWLYAKLYTGTATADQVLREVVAPVARAVLHAEAAEQWFFLRYRDPDWHVRLRFHGDPCRLQSTVLPTLQAAVAPLLEDGRVWRLQLDTYEREIERYGGPAGMVLAERLFHADSEAVVTLVEMLGGNAGNEVRWRLALRGIDMLFTDFGFDLAAKGLFSQRFRDAFGREFRVDQQMKRQLSDKFRQERKSLEALLDPEQDAHSPLAPGIAILQQRSTRLVPIVADLHAAAQAGLLTQSLPSLVWSYAHLYVNRLLRSVQRAQEMVLYDFLDRLYQSQSARARNRLQPVA